MNLDKYISLTTEELVPDDAFIRWVLHPEPSTDRDWVDFLALHPDMRKRVSEAAFIVKAMQPLEDEIPLESLNRIAKELGKELPKVRSRTLTFVLRAAAVLIIAVGAVSLFLLRQPKVDQYLLAGREPLKMEQGMVLLSDGSSVQFNTKDTRINQTSTGKLLINNDTARPVQKAGGSGTSGMNSIIIPYGKRSEVVLPDGSHVWLNSGSQLSYPPAFDGKTRDVYLAGEAFFDVEPNPLRPFQVFTHDVKIAVLGTRFNVSAYREDPTIQTVLLTGKVTIRKNSLLSRAEEMSPGERLVFSREEQVFSRDRVDPQYTTSWIYGYLVFEKEPTPGIFRKLERYYNQTIRVEPSLENISFSGKLDLKENLKDVLDNIAFASSVKISEEEGGYFIRK